jgi:hypothetical protein
MFSIVKFPLAGTVGKKITAKRESHYPARRKKLSIDIEVLCGLVPNSAD